MTTSKQDLWQHVKTNNFTKATEMIKQNPELVNSTDSSNISLLMCLLITFTENSSEFIKFVITHPKLDIQYVKSDNSSNIRSIIKYKKPDILQYVINNPSFLISGQKLTYEILKKYLDTSAKLLNEGSEPRLQQFYKDEIAAYQKMIPIIRDATIRHAVETDNADWMERLKIAGAEPATAMSDGKTASQLLNRRPGKVYDWLKKDFKETMDRGVQESARLQHNLSIFADSHAEMARIEREKEALKANNLVAKNAILENNLTEKKSFLSRVFGK